MAKEIKAIKAIKATKAIYDSDIVCAINEVVEKCSHFKIGKTGETIQDRGNQPDYQEYDLIQSLFSSPSEDLISILEKRFIDMFIDHSKNDNDKTGEQSVNDEMAKSDEYHLYIVWKQ